MPEYSGGLKVLSLVLLTLQGTILPLLVRWSRVREPEEMFLATSSVFFNEVVKLIVCAAILIYTEKSVTKFLKSVYEAIVLNPMETFKVCIPSIAYTIQNNLYYVALSNLDASIYCVTYQLKILVTALFFVGLLKRSISRMQWVSLTILMIGVSMVQLQEQRGGGGSADGDQNRVLGFAAVLTMCCTSGFAGVYFEKVLKGSKLSLWLNNIRLALIGIPLTFISMLLDDPETVLSGNILRGYDWLVWLSISINAAGGLIIAVVMKYADNILKAYAQSLAIVLACVSSSIWFNFIPSALFLGGTSLVILSIVLYAQFPPTPSAPEKKDKYDKVEPRENNGYDFDRKPGLRQRKNH